MFQADVWGSALSFLFYDALNRMNLHPMKLTPDAPEVTVAQDPRFRKTRVTITFWVEPE